MEVCFYRYDNAPSGGCGGDTDMVRMNTIVQVLCGLLIMSGSVTAATIDLNKPVEKIHSDVQGDSFGVTIDDYYYTVQTDQGLVQKIELNGSEPVDFNITTDTETIIELMSEYQSGMGWVRLAGFLVNRLGVPTEAVIGVLS